MSLDHLSNSVSMKSLFLSWIIFSEKNCKKHNKKLKHFLLKYCCEFVPESLLRLQIEACPETENFENLRKGEGHPLMTSCKFGGF